MRGKRVEPLNRTCHDINKLIPLGSTSELLEAKRTECQMLKQKLMGCQEEIYKLQAANSDLNRVNKRWQMHNNDVQMFIQKLQTTIQDQAEQISKMGEERVLRVHEVGEEKEVEGCECASLKDSAKKLNEKVELLEFQVKAHKDDWEAEKHEKEAALKENNTLKQLIRDLMNEKHSNASRFSQTQGDESAEGVLMREMEGVDGEGDEEDGARALRVSGDEPFRVEALLPQGRGVCEGGSGGSVERSLSDTQTIALGFRGRGQTLTSYVHLPIVKSSSAPERKFTSHSKKSPKMLGTISLSVLPSKGSSKHKEQPPPGDITCPVCQQVFLPDAHLQFIDHFEECQKKSSQGDMV